MRPSRWMGLALALLVLGAVGVGCSCSDGTATGDDGGTNLRPDGTVGMDADTAVDGGGDPGTDGGGMDVGPAGEGGVVALPDGGFLLPDGATVGCLPATCGGFLRLCGDCIDNDDDGLVDSADPGCIGPCDNTEDRYDLDIRDTPTCNRDCYYDNDQGSGNDGCSYDSRCDPLSPDAPDCPYRPGGGGGISCPDTQPTLCDDVCGPLVPNGCDCFGCCELPSGSGSYVFLGSVDPAGERTCAPENVGDPTICRPCTPVAACLNECGHCELCLGRTELPPDCFPPPPPPDAGVSRDDAGAPIDAGPQPDGGTPPPRCEPGYQPCGLPGDAPCEAGWYCLTGCCIYFG